MVKRKAKGLLTTLTLALLFGTVNIDAYAMDNSISGQAIVQVAALANSNTQVVDKLKPVIDYAYVEDGKLKISISDNDELANKPIIYKIDKELHYYEIAERDYEYNYDGRKKMDKIYEIEVEIPSSISIIIRDYTGNESTYKFSIKEDYVALTKYIPQFVMEGLAKAKQSKVNKFKGYEDIFELEYGKVVEAFSLYDEVIKDKYNTYNRNDIKFKFNGLSSDKSGNIKLDKYGVFKVTMTHNKDKTFEESAYILIKPDWRDTDIGRPLVNMNPYIVYKDKIKIADYFKHEDETGNKKLDTTYLLVYNENTGQTVSVTDQISLELNKTYKIRVLNFENNSQQDLYIMRQEQTKSANKGFTDLDKNYWAAGDINALVSKGLISGYPDGRFNPKGNITVKEFMSILSKQIATAPTKAKPVVGDVTIPISPGTWGYIESKSVLDRLDINYLFKFNYLNLDRPINREEVAYLIDNTLELGTAYATNVNKPLIDVATSPYYAEITKLVDLGLISGYPDGTYRPSNNITRAEIASIFAKIK